MDTSQSDNRSRRVNVRQPDEGDQRAALERVQTLRGYYGWVFSNFESHIGRTVLDAGCGIGAFTKWLAGQSERVIAVDWSQKNLELVERRCGADTLLFVEQLDLETSDLSGLRQHQIDTVVCLDVLEHLADDVGALQRLAAVAVTGARLLVKVPACPKLYGTIDESSGHFRRYSRATLCEAAQAAGWRPLFCKPMNLGGIFPYWFKSHVLKNRTNFSRTFRPETLRLISTAIPLLRIIDRLTGPPAGLSLVMAAVKCEGTGDELQLNSVHSNRTG